MERRNTNYVMAYCKIASGVMYIIALLLPYGKLYESAWIRYRSMHIYDFGESGLVVTFIVALMGLVQLLVYVEYLWAPKLYYIGGLRSASVEKAEKVLKKGKISAFKYKLLNGIEIAGHVFVIYLNLLYNLEDVSWGENYFDSYGPGRYLIFLAAAVGILGAFWGILLASTQAADELDWWTAVYEGKINSSGAFVNKVAQAASGMKSTRAVKSPDEARPATGQKISYCPRCGAQCKPGALFCKNCGEKIEEDDV